MKLWGIALLALLALSGCATIDMDCPDTGSQTITIGGSNVGNQIISLGTAAAHAAGYMAPGPPGAPPPPKSHVHYTYVPIFGTDSVSCTYAAPLAVTPTPLSVTVEPPRPGLTKP